MPWGLSDAARARIADLPDSKPAVPPGQPGDGIIDSPPACNARKHEAEPHRPRWGGALARVDSIAIKTVLPRSWREPAAESAPSDNEIDTVTSFQNAIPLARQLDKRLQGDAFWGDDARLPALCDTDAADDGAAEVPAVQRRPDPPEVTSLAKWTGSTYWNNQALGEMCDTLLPSLRSITEPSLEANADPNSYKLVEYLTRDPESKISTQTSDANRFGTTRKYLQEVKRILTSLLIYFQRRSADKFVDAMFDDIKDKDGSMVLLAVGRQKYDETPMKVAAHDLEFIACMASGARAGGEHDVRSPGTGKAAFLQVFRDSVPRKLLRNQNTTFMVVKSEQSSYWLIEIPFATWVQLMDSTKAECYWRANHDSIFDLRKYRDKIAFLMRHAATDGDGAVKKSERKWKPIDGVSNLHTVDVMHRGIGARNKSLELMEGAVS